MNRRAIIISLSIGLATGVGGCGSSGQPAPDPSVAPMNAETPAIAPSYATQVARFDEEDHGTYYYIADISEENRKKGKAVGDVIGFRYLGKNDQGEHVLLQVTDDGSPIGKAYCTDPCKIIRTGSRRMGFSADSIIGAAFEDAINGHLKEFGAKKMGASSAPTGPDDEDTGSPIAGEASLWPGRYTGTFEGGADGDVAIAASSPGKLRVSISVGSAGCAGEVSGLAAINASQVILRKPSDESGNQCNVTLFRRGDRVDVSESACTYFHGAACSFNGVVRRR